jgi:prepilin-type N-terminal cleavage/methylation domain-containing protein
MNRRMYRRTRGFTLIEMTMAIVIVSIIMLGCFSVVLLASKSLPDRTSGPSATAAAALAMDQLSYDLTYASAVSVASANDVEFLVQDRDGNGMADKIRYTWSGTAGGALNRYYSPGDPATGTYTYSPPTTVLAGVQEFALVYDKRSKSYAVTSGESAEMPLASYDSNSNLATSTITGTNYIGEYFVPNLPAGALAWKVTRVKFKARVNGFPDGILTYQIRTASSGLPSSTVLDSGTLNESRFSSFYTWQQVNFTTATGLTPGSGACFLLMLNAASPAGDIQYQTTAAPTLAFNALTSPGSSTAWTAPVGQSMNFQVYGTVTASTATVTQYNLTGVRVTLRNSVDTSGRVRATVRTLNEPAVSGP